MKKSALLLALIILALSFSACGDNKDTLSFYKDSSSTVIQSPNAGEDGESSRAENTEDSSPYSNVTVSVYAKNSSFDYYDMVFENNRLIYVDIEDANGMFNETCKGTFGKDAPNAIMFSGMTHLTVESAKKFFEDKGFEVTITQK